MNPIKDQNYQQIDKEILSGEIIDEPSSANDNLEKLNQYINANFISKEPISKKKSKHIKPSSANEPISTGKKKPTPRFERLEDNFIIRDLAGRIEEIFPKEEDYGSPSSFKKPTL